MNAIYLDNNATTRVAPEVLDAMLPYLGDRYGNPSSLHRVGAAAAVALKEARERAAAFLNCRESELVFTSGGTESNNAAIAGVLEAAPHKKHVVTTRVEHPSVLEYCRFLEDTGYRVTYLGVNRDGLLDLAELEEAVTDDTALVSIMYANNETGVIFPIKKIAAVIGSRGVPLHVDAVQAAGKLPLDMSQIHADLLTVSGHKLHASKGAGLLYIRRGTRTSPFIIGGGQERGRRSGTENIPAIVGMGKALEMAGENREKTVDRIRRLRDTLEDGILSNTPNAVRNGTPDSRLPNTSNISFDGVEGEAVLLLFDEAGICASSGSACATGAIEPSHVLKAMGVPNSLAQGSVRFSLSRYTTAEEIDRVVETIPAIIDRLNRLSAHIPNRKEPS
jgi:cysteine desulfurase